MVLRVDYLIFAYMILCLCLLLFDFFYIVQERWTKAREPKKIEQCKQSIVLILSLPTQKLNKKKHKHLVRMLRNHKNLLIFHEAVSQILLDELDRARMESCLWENRELFFEISGPYIKGRNKIKVAFFTYIVWQYKLCGQTENDAFVQMMYQSCMEVSLYCRENALCALYVCGSSKNVVKAYLLISRQGIEHTPMLVTDGLMMFSGDHNELADALWEYWGEFSAAYQTAFINYIRMTSSRFGERFYRLLLEQNIDSEVKFAIIRYFRRYHCPYVEPILQKMVRDWDQDDWEFASIAALALENYPGNNSVQALLEGCRSVHWYVRDNASESLMKIVSPEVIQEIIEQETDAFTKDMLNYKWSRSQEVVGV